MMIALLLSAAAVQAAWVLTPDGLGPVRIGMTIPEVSRALKAKLEGEAIESDDICVEKDAVDYPGVGFMFEEKRLTRISISKPSRIKTVRRIGINATAAQVKRAYGPRLQAENHKYEERPAQYLTFWTVPDRRGVNFETGRDRRVQIIHAGRQSILYVEGCA